MADYRLIVPDPESELRWFQQPFMNQQYPVNPYKVPLKDIPHTTKKRDMPNIIIQNAPPPVAHRYEPQYPYLPYDYPKEISDLGTTKLKHIYQVKALNSPEGWSMRRPTQMTTLRAQGGLYSPNGPIEEESSFFQGGAPPRRGLRGPAIGRPTPNDRRLNLTGPKPQVKIREPVTRGPFWSPNPEEGYMVWEDLGLA